MLETIQSQFKSVVLFGLIILLSAVFILEFGGPQAQGCSTIMDGATYAARVQGQTITTGDFRAAYIVPGFNQYRAEQARALHLRELMLDGLVERELLANAALELGFRVSSDDVMDELLETGTIYVNTAVDAPEGFPGPDFDVSTGFQDRNGNFSARRMRNFIANALRRSTDEFLQWQVREHLARLARQAVEQGVVVSAQEVHDTYVLDTDRAQLDYVQYRPSYYRDRVELSDANVTAWMAEHRSEVDEEYTRQRHRYTGLEEQVRARHILVKVAENASDADRDVGRARAEAILARVRGGEDFATVARAESEDEGSARRGGDLGFNPRGRMVAPFDEAQFSTEPGQITDHVVESRFGYHIIKVEARREGDVPEDEAKREIAEDLYARARAGELAQEEANRALAYLREGHSMEELHRQLAFGWNPPAEGDDTPEPTIDSLAPDVRETRRFGRMDAPISGAFDSGPLGQAAFELTLAAPLPEAPMRLGEDYFVFRLKDREEATDEGFTDEVRERIADALLRVKRVEAVRAYVHELRARAEQRGEIRIDERILLYGDESQEGSGSDDDREQESMLPRPARPLDTEDIVPA